MTNRAWAYVLGVIALGGALGVWALTGFVVQWLDALTFLVFVASATLTQLFKELFQSQTGNTTGTTSYSPTLIFLFAGALLLPRSFFVLLVIFPHLVEWLYERRNKSANLPAWYIQPFNISTHIIAGVGASWVYRTFNAGGMTMLSPLPLVVAIAAAFVYVVLNHYLVGLALVLARGVSWRESGVWSRDNLASDTIMTSLGFAVAVLWTLNPWLILPALAPLILIQRSLMVPQLKQEARIDVKTGLWNARHFAQLFGSELERARRFERSLGFVMADLDLLRNVNNTYGHLAGDAVLAGVGEVIQKTIREYDIAARFGGEEFAIVLPEVSPAEAQAMAERLREAVEATPFTIPTSPTPIHVTMSVGISCFPIDATQQVDLIHLADVAVYQAKLRGRNCSVWGADIPHALQLRGTMPAPQVSDYVAAHSLENAVPDSVSNPTLISSNASQSAHSTAKAASPIRNGLGKLDSAADAVGELYPGYLMPLFVGSIIALGAIVAGIGMVVAKYDDLTALVLVACLAILTEVLKVTVYEDSNISVSVAILFMAAVLTGIPGIVLVSTTATIVHYYQMRSRWYKNLFNWATHILAGAVPALAIKLVSEDVLVNAIVLLIPVLGAAILYFAIESGLVAIAISIAKRQRIFSTWRQQFGWLAGHYVVLSLIGVCMAFAYQYLGWFGVVIFALPIFVMHSAQKMYVERTERNVAELKRMNAEISAANEQIKSAGTAIQNLNEELFATLGKIIDARDPFVLNHAWQVAVYAEAIGKHFGFDVKRLEVLRQAAFLHDIGKIGISESILQKNGKLTPEEYEIVKRHPVLGASFLETCAGLRHLAPFVRHHHERWDGTGYPDHLSGEQIPLESRILAVCDAAEAMASDRPYKEAMPIEEILREIRQCVGTQFDPLVTETFLHIVQSKGGPPVTNSALETVQRKENAANATSESAEGVSHKNLSFVSFPGLDRARVQIS